MGHRRGNPVICLRISEEGIAELLSDHLTLWAMDSDPDFIEEFGQDLLERGPLDPEAVDDVLDYLVDAAVLTENQTTHVMVEQPEVPEGDDSEGSADDDDDEEEPDA